MRTLKLTGKYKFSYKMAFWFAEFSEKCCGMHFREVPLQHQSWLWSWLIYGQINMAD